MADVCSACVCPWGRARDQGPGTYVIGPWSAPGGGPGTICWVGGGADMVVSLPVLRLLVCVREPSPQSDRQRRLGATVLYRARPNHLVR